MKSNESLPEGSIYDNKIGYNPNIEGYTTFMSHINEILEELKQSMEVIAEEFIDDIGSPIKELRVKEESKKARAIDLRTKQQKKEKPHSL